MAFDIKANQGLGTEDLTANGMPVLRILQDLSPQLKPQKKEYVEGSKVGDIFFAKESMILGNKITLIPIKMEVLYTEWNTRENGGGLVAIHPLTITDSPTYKKARKGKYDEWLGDNELHVTHYWFLQAEINGEWKPVIIPMSKSQLKVSRELQKKIKGFRYEDEPTVKPNIFARKVMLSTSYEENDNGDGYYNWSIDSFVVLDPEEDEDLLVSSLELTKSAEKYLPETTKQVSLPDEFLDDDSVEI